MKERMGKYYEEKPFKIHVKRKKIITVKFQMLFTKTLKTLKEKKPTKAQTKTVGSRKAKTTIKHPRVRKKLREEKMVGSNSSCCYLESLTLIPKKFQINNFYLT